MCLARSTLLFLLFILLGQPAFADWNSTHYGMTVEEIQKLYPGAKRISPASDQRTATLLTNYEENGLKFQLEFVFMQNRLVQARLTLQQVERCGDVLAGLEKRFGVATTTETPPQVVRKSWLGAGENVYFAWASTDRIKACVIAFNAVKVSN